MFGGSSAWFGVPAALGTLYFIIRLVLMLAGVAGGGDVDLDASADAPHGDSSHAMKVLSIHSLSAFLMGFGWGGLAAHHGFDVPWAGALLWGLGAGAAMVWVEAMLLKLVHDLQSSGTLPIDAALGAEGTVYVRVPGKGEGSGQVRVVIAGRDRVYTAVSEGEVLERNARVRVVRVNDDNTVSVAASA
jgi:hypothetical protein